MTAYGNGTVRVAASAGTEKGYWRYGAGGWYGSGRAPRSGTRGTRWYAGGVRGYESTGTALRRYGRTYAIRTDARPQGRQASGTVRSRSQGRSQPA
jgi:hypothetical protein